MAHAHRDTEVKTTLSWDEYRAMEVVVSVKGMTQAGYLRHLILQDICDSQDLVSQMQDVLSRVKTGQKTT